jgi:NAD(P)-dependent dehydrogenase (short-subunit alcohol dehydrogenase family)
MVDTGNSLAGRRALVTGAGQGVGRGIARSLALEGASLALMGRTESKLATVATELEGLGAKVVVVAGDVTEPSDIDRCVAGAVSGLGGLDILVNNAQQTALGSLLEVSDDELQTCWESGTLATFRLMKACHEHLRGHGVIINLGSSTTANPMPTGRGAYSAVKAATQTLSRVAGVEWGADGIRVIAVLPAAMTPAAQAYADAMPEQFERSLDTIPLHRLGDPVNDIGRAVAFLCSDAAGYITATSIALDGGQAFLR